MKQCEHVITLVGSECFIFEKTPTKIILFAGRFSMFGSCTSEGDLDICEVLNVYMVGIFFFFFRKKSVLVFMAFKSCPGF